MIFICFWRLKFRLRISRHCPPNGEWGACFWNPGGNKSRGVGIGCNISLEFQDLEVKTDFHGRLMNEKLFTELTVSDYVYLCS